MKMHRAVAVALIGLSTQAAFAAATGTIATSKGISREAQEALICQVVSDWSAFKLAELIRDGAKTSRVADSQGIQILREIRLTEGLASITFDKLAPEANHDAMYQDAVGKMRLYVKEDREAADTNAKRMVKVCQQTYGRMTFEGTLTMGEIQAAWDASGESVTRLTEELEGQGYSVRP